MNTNDSTLNNQINQDVSILPRMLPLKEVIHYTGLGCSTIYDMMNEKSNRHDPTFPRQVKLGKNRVAWVESELAEWLNSRIQARSV